MMMVGKRIFLLKWQRVQSSIVKHSEFIEKIMMRNAILGLVDNNYRHLRKKSLLLNWLKIVIMLGSLKGDL